MLKITKQTDYGVLLMAYLTSQTAEYLNARELSDGTGVAFPMTRKILKMLAKSGLLESGSGPQGGFRLARESDSISVADIIEALEGPISVVECIDHDCSLEEHCPASDHWTQINRRINEALRDVTLKDIARPTKQKHFRREKTTEDSPDLVNQGVSRIR